MAYVLYIDYMAGHQPDMEYKALYVENLLDAIAEVDALMTENSDVYLMRIMERCNSEMKETRYHAENGEPRALLKAEYKAILCKRNTSPESDWHLNTEEHGEAEHIVRRCIDVGISDNLDSEYFELVK